MVRSLRLSSFALVASIALFGFGCGGGGDDKPATQEDGGSKIQLDGGTVKQDASSPTQQDSGSGGGTNTCTTGGGNATGGLCSHFNSDCQCPNDCMNLFYEQDPTTKSSGSCWPQVDATSETGCPSGQVPVQFTETDPGHCYPSGTLSGTFEVPVGTAVRFKITAEDWRNREKWDLYQSAAADMIERTSTARSPWTLVEANDKKFARVKVLKTICKRIEGALDQL